MKRSLKSKSDLEDMYREMVESDSDEMDFMVTREKREPGLTVSAEALRKLNATVNAFILSRVEHHWGVRGKDKVGPSVIKAEVKITVDDVHVVPDPGERPWYVVDGNRRLDA